MDQKIELESTNTPVKSHILCEGKKASSKIQFDLNSQSTNKKLKPIILNWNPDSHFTYILS